MSVLRELDASALVAKVKAGQVTVAEIAESVIERVAARDDEVQAWAYFNADEVRARAAELDAKSEKGPLHGVPLAIKDVFNTKDMPTEHNSARYVGSRPGVDAAAVDTLRAAGALLLGKTVTTEFAATLRGGKTRNPHDLTRTPGGSSSGSAAAVADFQATIALGTQTGGSTIRPASFNGVYALKPTWSAISREGFKLGTISSYTVGLYARSAADLSLLADVFELDALEGGAPTSLVGARIGICRTPFWDRAQPEMVAAIAECGVLLRAVGATVSELVLPSIFDDFSAAQMLVSQRETRATFLNEYRTTPGLHPEFKRRVESRDGFSASMTRNAYRTIDVCKAEFDDTAAGYDVILTPSAAGEAPVGQDWTGEASFNSIWTFLQVPVVSVPGMIGPSGLPLGMSLVSRRYEDRKGIAMADLLGALLLEERIAA